MALAYTDPSQRAALVGEIAAGIPVNCRGHWRSVLSEIPPRIGTAEEFFAWTVEAHNAVSSRIGNSTMTITDARTFWTHTPAR